MRLSTKFGLITLLLTFGAGQLSAQAPNGKPFPGTQPLTLEGDIASQLVEGVDRFLLRELEASVQKRVDAWPKPGAAGADYQAAVEGLRKELGERIGMRDKRLPVDNFTVLSKPNQVSHLVTDDRVEIHSIRWPLFDGVESEGLLVMPASTRGLGKPKIPVRFIAVLIPDSGQFPEDLCGFGPNANTNAIDLAHQGGLVVIPQGIGRHREARNARSQLTDQEYLYRSAFILGRHILGYQVAEVMSAFDVLIAKNPKLPVMIGGWGEGGWVALHAAAIDPRIKVACISGHFGPRERVWDEPIHRNVHGLLKSFGDAQLAALVAPRTLIIDASPGPSVDIPGEGGAPGKLSGPTVEQAQAELLLAKKILEPWQLDRSLSLSQPTTASKSGSGISREGLTASLTSMSIPPGKQEPNTARWKDEALETKEVRRLRTLGKWDRFQQRLLDTISIERTTYWANLDTSSPEKFAETSKPYLDHFREEVIGRWDIMPLPPNPRSRQIYDQPKWEGYEVVFDLFPDVMAYGVLLMPKGIKEGEHRPCVVFQHGLEGRPKDVIEGNHEAYHDVAAKLAEQGYVVFAPQNLYIFQDRFRTLQRKSNPLGKTLFSTIVPQHQQIVDWLSTLSQVDSKRIAFYGLSYGGKSAMRIPVLVPNYCLSICSADFNDWVWKNASTSSNYSYVWTNEYEIFEFGLGPKFNYAEMATLIAPRPFMVERGHFDGVAPDERVGLEFARVQHLYAAKLGLADRCKIEWFVGPHTINGKGTFDFLKQHLGPIEGK